MTRALWLALALAFGPVAVATAQSVEPIPADLRLAPAEGRRTAGPGGRGFCPARVEPLSASHLQANRLRGLLDLRKVAGGEGPWKLDQVRDLKEVATLACAHGSDPNTRGWLTSFRQLIVNATAADDRAIDALLGGALAEHDRRWSADCDGAPALGNGSPPDARLERQFLRELACDEGSRVSLGKVVYWVDRIEALGGGQLSVATRAGLVRQALRTWSHREISAPAEVRLGSGFAGWVAVRNDVAALDLDVARRELANSGLDATEQTLALMRIGRVRVAAEALGRAWTAAAAAEPVLAPLADELPRRLMESWRRDSAAHAEALGRAWAVETAWLSGRTAQGCDEALQADLLAYLRQSPPADRDGLLEALERPVGYLLAAALFRCEKELGHEGRALALHRLIGDFAPQRGPRMAALNALRQVAGAAAARSRSFVMPLVSFDPAGQIDDAEDWVYLPFDQGGSTERGVVRAVQNVPLGVRITFGTEQVTVDQRECTPTNRIRRIERDGRVVYEEDCRTVGQLTLSVTPDPVLIPSAFRGGIRPGAWLDAVRGLRDDERGYPIEVRSGPRGNPVALFGVPVR